MKVTETEILAAFTHARRTHRGLTQAALEAQCGIRAGQVSSAECRRFISKETREKLIAFNELEGFEHGR